jgi:hypothetical protein
MRFCDMAHFNYENTYSLEPAFIDRIEKGRFYNKFCFWTSKFKKKNIFFRIRLKFFLGWEGYSSNYSSSSPGHSRKSF